MEFTVGGKGGFTATDTFDPNHKNATGKYYGFTCYVNSIQMAEEITAVFHYGDGETIEKTYSVERYIKAAEKLEDPLLKNLSHAIADYGHYAQEYLSELRGWTIGSDYAEMATYYTEGGYADQWSEILEEVEDKKIVKDLEGTAITKVTYSLNLDSNTEVYLYLTVAEGYSGEVRAKIGDEEIECTKRSDGRYRAVISNISAHKIGDQYTVKIETETGEARVEVSALSYVRAILKNSENSKEKDLMAALYRYYEATMAYRE